MDYDSWEQSVPSTIRMDTLWKLESYRLALYACDVGWEDVTRLCQDKRTIGLSDQLYRALGSIAANIAEGYSKSSPKDRARFYEYALGSGRESRGWYYKGRHVLGQPIVEQRLTLITQIIRLLLTMVPSQRGYTIREDSAEYMPENPVSQD